MIEEMFLDLVRISFSAKKSFDSAPSDDDWTEMLRIAKDQSVAGVLCDVINAVPEEQAPSKMVARQWMMIRCKVAKKNTLQNERARQLTEMLAGKGMRSCVLKGQGAAMHYPDPETRQAGDIDMWVEGGREVVLGKLKGRVPLARPVYHHVDARFFADVPVEVHFIPAWLYNPVSNARIQKFFRDRSDAQFSNIDPRVGFAHPEPSFNVVFSLAHIFKHIINEGVGLRQLMDYHYNLMALDEESRGAAAGLLKHLGLYDVAAAVMYIEVELFGTDASKLLCPPDVRRGRKLLEDVMLSGNFGHSDKRKGGKKSRFLRFVLQYPSEVLCSPFWKAWHRIWRMFKGYL